MTSAVLTPVRKSETQQLGGRLFRKQVLPATSINYRGRKLEFTPEYLAGLKASYDDNAYDAVKLFFAPDDNSHTVDPERIRGDVKGFEVTDDGLDMLVEAANDEAAKLLRENPNLGVSARIVEDLSRADGKSFPAAIQHVLATVDPVVTGMRPWEAVDLSNDDKQLTTVDLSDHTYTDDKEPVVPDTLTPDQLKAHLAGLPEDQRAALLKDLAPPAASTTADGLTPEQKAEADRLLASIDDDALAGAALSADRQAAIDLAVAQAADARSTASQLATDLAKERWENEAQTLLAAGVPKALINLAAPWCGGEKPKEFIDLSNSETTVEQVRAAAAADLRKFLDACKGAIDLSVIGTTEANEATDPVYDRWVAEHPHV